MTSSTTSLREPGGSGRESFWVRIAAELADAIRQGLYAPGQRLPSEHALAEQFGVNRHTIRRSLASLCSEGVLRVTQGSGTYVEDFAIDVILSRRTRHQHNMALVGLRGHLLVLKSEKIRATAAAAKGLAMERGASVLRLSVLGQAEGQPIHYSVRHFPLPRFTDLAEQVRATGSITAAFAAHGVADYTRRESHISAQLPSAEVAAYLHQPVARPVLQVDSVNVDLAGVPIEWSSAWFPGDRIKLTVNHDES
jgi:GntR family phosphonate transport system transcriptional regulator